MEQTMADRRSKWLIEDALREVEYIHLHGRYEDYFTILSLKNLMEMRIGKYIKHLFDEEPAIFKATCEVLHNTLDKLVELAESLADGHRVDKEKYKEALKEMMDSDGGHQIG